MWMLTLKFGIKEATNPAIFRAPSKVEVLGFDSHDFPFFSFFEGFQAKFSYYEFLFWLKQISVSPEFQLQNKKP